MEEITQTILDLGEIKLLKRGIDPLYKYYIVRLADDVEFDLDNNWKSNKKNKYITSSTKRHIINTIRQNHIHREGVRDFIEWYDYVESHKGENSEVENTEKEANQNNVNINLEETNALIKEMSDKMERQNAYIQTNIIEAMTDKILQIKAEDIANRLQSSVDGYIERTYGTLPNKYEFTLPDMTTKTDTGIFHKELPNIMKFITADIPLILTGPAGSGKNFTLEKAAENLGFDFYFTNAVTQEYKLTGFIDAHGVYQETQFYKAFKDGGVFFLDEIDASVPEALIILNAAIANKYFDFPNGRINAHPDFRVVAAANTYGTGSDIIYVGRNVLDGATLDRFAVVEFDYDERVERDKCPDKDLYDFILSIRNGVNAKKLRYTISIRAMINSYKMLKCGFDKEYIIKTAITKSMTDDDINSIKENIIKNEWYTALKNVYNI